jgi:hypothetical protein
MTLNHRSVQSLDYMASALSGSSGQINFKHTDPRRATAHSATSTSLFMLVFGAADADHKTTCVR